MNIIRIPGCRQCPHRDEKYYCSEGGQYVPSACRPADPGYPSKPHVVPDWCPALDATLRGRHVVGIQLRMRPGAGKSFCEFVYVPHNPTGDRHVSIKDW